MEEFKHGIKIFFTLLLSLISFMVCSSSIGADIITNHRIIVSTDIGGTDPDDFQSMVHLLVYADTLFDIEGIISSPHGNGRKKHILEVIDAYEKDYPNLLSHSSGYPAPDSLRKITKQGETEIASPIGFRNSTEGSNWIIECSKRNDSRPLHILVWGGIEDLAQALHDAPDIMPILRVYWIGGPNKKWSVNAYQYIADNFPELWIIESNATYRGWFTGGNQSGEWSNSGFVNSHIAGHGALGNLFNAKKNSLKMGDTPSLARLIHGTPEDPSQPSWGGQYVRAWERPHVVFNRLTTASDRMEEFGVLELLLPFDTTTVTNPVATMDIDRDIPGLVIVDTVKFLFSPKKVAKFDYTIISNIPSLSGQKGSITAYLTPEENKLRPSPDFPNWWTDDPLRDVMEQGHIGAKTVNQWRVDYLSDFAKRMDRCKIPAGIDVQKQEDNMMPVGLKLSQNYSNPFNQQTTIKYALDKSTHVTLKIYNVSGQEIETLVEGNQAAGEYKIAWQVNGLPSGIYFYKLQAGGFIIFMDFMMAMAREISKEISGKYDSCQINWVSGPMSTTGPMDVWQRMERNILHLLLKALHFQLK